MIKRPTVLTIAGSDPSGGAGIQADIKSISANGGYAASVITVLTAQNTQGISAIATLPIDFIAAQLDAVFSDLDIHAVKIGMLHSIDVIECVGEKLRQYSSKNIVLDPVMIAKGGAALLEPSAIESLKNLFPLTTLLTPNLPEAEALMKTSLFDNAAIIDAAQHLAARYQTNVLIKGGHAYANPRAEVTDKTAHDYLYLYLEKKGVWFKKSRIDTPNTHGTGCTLSSAIATYLAKKETLSHAVKYAKNYVHQAIIAGSHVKRGHGHGPIEHFL